MNIRYTFLKNCRREVLQFPTLEAAMDAACQDILDERTMPFEIATDEGPVISAMELCELFDVWLDWKENGGEHPVSSWSLGRY